MVMSPTISALINNPAPDDTSNRKKVIKHSLIEFFATGGFIYLGTLAAVSTGTKLGDGDDVARVFPIAFAFGITIMCLVYAIGHITGGHMNPGVSLLMYFQRQMSLKKMVCYWFAQLLGGLAASGLVWASVSNYSSNPPFLLGSTTLDDNISAGNGFLLEMLGSFFFYFVISQTALDKTGIATTSFPAIPIGFSLVVVHICLVPFTGCGVNPARTFGPAMVLCTMASSDECANAVGDWWWIYYVGPFVAAFLVAEITHLVNWDVEDRKYETANIGDMEDEEDPFVGGEEDQFVGGEEDQSVGDEEVE